MSRKEMFFLALFLGLVGLAMCIVAVHARMLIYFIFSVVFFLLATIALPQRGGKYSPDNFDDEPTVSAEPDDENLIILTENSARQKQLRYKLMDYLERISSLIESVNSRHQILNVKYYADPNFFSELNAVILEQGEVWYADVERLLGDTLKYIVLSMLLDVQQVDMAAFENKLSEMFSDEVMATAVFANEQKNAFNVIKAYQSDDYYKKVSHGSQLQQN